MNHLIAIGISIICCAIPALSAEPDGQDPSTPHFGVEMSSFVQPEEEGRSLKQIRDAAKIPVRAIGDGVAINAGETPTNVQDTEFKPVPLPAKPSATTPTRKSSPIIEQWVCSEQVLEEHGGYEIEWRYTFQRIGTDLIGHGNKFRVNGKPATWGEQKTVSVLWLHNFEGRWEGTYEETNHKGEVMRGKLIARFQKDGLLLVAETYDGSEMMSRLKARPLTQSQKR